MFHSHTFCPKYIKKEKAAQQKIGKRLINAANGSISGANGTSSAPVCKPNLKDIDETISAKVLLFCAYTQHYIK
jgi:hypothetical protein